MIRRPTPSRGRVTLEMAAQVDTPMIEEICMDNEQDVKLYR